MTRTQFFIRGFYGDPPKLSRLSLLKCRIEMPTSFSSGQTTFKVSNADRAAHNFEIEGQSIKLLFDADLRPVLTRSTVL